MTDNINRRLTEHNGHHNSTITTKLLSDYELIFCQEVENRFEARKLEKYLKSGTGREIRSEIIGYMHGSVAQSVEQ